VENEYGVFMIDPPWEKRKGGLRQVRPLQGKNLPYATMSIEAIFHLLDTELFNLAQEIHCVFIWTIETYLLECENFMVERNYKRHCRFIWDKLSGIAPAFTIRYCHEYLLWYYKPTLLPISKSYRGVYRSVFSERSRQHSRKPDYAYAMVEHFYPLSKKIDVFSREKRPGWEQYGNEVDFFQ
jgi:N6-adenosine-specific RNA methylase IME4